MHRRIPERKVEDDLRFIRLLSSVSFEESLLSQLRDQRGYRAIPDDLAIGTSADTDFYRQRFLAHDNKCYVGTISLGYEPSGQRRRRTARGATKTEVQDKLKKLREEIDSGIRTPATYTIEQCVRDWLDSLTLDDNTIAGYRRQAKKWIYPEIGSIKLKDFRALDAEKFFAEISKSLSKRALVMIKSTLRRSIQRAQKHDLIHRNVVKLIEVPEGQPGRPSRAMTEDQVDKVLDTARGATREYDRVVTISRRKGAATHIARDGGDVACGAKLRHTATVTRVGTDLTEATCRTCRTQVGLDGAGSIDRLQALVTLAVMLGLRPGELRALRWDHVDLSAGVIHIWKSPRRDEEVKTPQSRRSLLLPKPAIAALEAHEKRQAAERQAAEGAWKDHNLVFCHEDGRPYSRDALQWRFGKITRQAGLGHWRPYEARHTAVSILSANGVPIQEIADTVGHKSTHVTETVYRKVIVPTIRSGATTMDTIFGNRTADP